MKLVNTFYSSVYYPCLDVGRSWTSRYLSIEYQATGFRLNRDNQRSALSTQQLLRRYEGIKCTESVVLKSRPRHFHHILRLRTRILRVSARMLKRFARSILHRIRLVSHTLSHRPHRKQNRMEALIADSYFIARVSSHQKDDANTGTNDLSNGWGLKHEIGLESMQLVVAVTCKSVPWAL